MAHTPRRLNAKITASRENSMETGEDSSPPAEALLERYGKTKMSLVALVKKEGDGFFRRKSETGFVGLINQGATCYMNSLIQALYMSPDFRARLYEWTYDAGRDGDAEFCIPLQLQRLMVNLQTSERPAASTNALTKSFGWTAADAFRQHDVQELCRVLFDKLEEATEDYNMVNDLFEGLLEDYLASTDGKYSRAREDKFADLELTVKGVEGGSLEDSLRAFVTPEEMSGANQWEVKDGLKVDANKGLCLSRLPRLLTLHLKRFTFDFERMCRVKVKDHLVFPALLDMTPFMKKGEATTMTSPEEMKPEEIPGGLSPAQAEAAAAGLLYELYAVLIHHGTAMGGHYFAYIKSMAKDKWYEFNDANVTELSEKEVSTMLFKASAAAAAAAANDDGEEAAAAAEKLEGSKSSSTTSTTTNTSTSTTPSAVTTSSSFGAAAENAYMVMYRRVGVPGRIPPDVPARLREEVGDVAANAKHRELVEMYKVHRNMVQFRVYVRAAADPAAAADQEGAAPAPEVGGTLSQKEEESKDTEEVDNVYSYENGIAVLEAAAADGPTLRQCALDAHNSTTLTALTKRAAKLLIPDAAARATLEASDRLRLRKFDPRSGRGVDTFDPEAVAAGGTLRELSLYGSEVVLLQVRDEGAGWDVFNPNEMVVCVAFWDAGAGAPWPAGTPGKSWTVTVEGDMAATVTQLKAAVQAEAGFSEASQRLVRLHGDEATILAIGERQINQDYGVQSHSSTVVLELLDPSLAPDAQPPSAVVAAYEAKRNVVVVKYNALDEPEKFEHEVTVDLRLSVGELKGMIAAKLGEGVEAETIHLRRNRRSAMLKDEKATLRSLRFVDGSIIFVARGRPLLPGQYDIEFFFWTPRHKDATQRLTKLCTMPIMASTSIRALKRLLSERLGHPADRIRVREKRKREAGAIFRDDRSLKACVKRIADGSAVAVQLLDAPERLTGRHMVLVTRRWRPKFRASVLEAEVEQVVEKRITVAQIKAQLRRFLAEERAFAEREGGATSVELPKEEATSDAAPPSSGGEEKKGGAGEEEDEVTATAAKAEEEKDGLEVAKWSTFFGPIATDKAAAKTIRKLKFNDPKVQPDCGLTAHPFSYRDGCVLIWRSAAAQASYMAEVKQARLDGRLKPKAAGSKSKGSRGTRKWKPPAGDFKVRAAKSRPEQGLRIRLVNKEGNQGAAAESEKRKPQEAKENAADAQAAAAAAVPPAAPTDDAGSSSTAALFAVPSEPVAVVKGPSYAAELAQLEAMGFSDEEKNLWALRRAKGQVQRALNYLMV